MNFEDSNGLHRTTTSDSPFQTRLYKSPPSILAAKPGPPASGSGTQDSYIQKPYEICPLEHFPVSFRTGASDENIHVIDHNTFSRFLEVEFSLERLENIHSKLWRVGYPRPPRSLTTQVQLGRMIVLTDALDMHLVWGGGKIFLKPLPRYLLEPEFWAAHLPSSEIRKSALGLLYTYACLITYPVDLKLALERGLIPKDAGNEPDWATWRKLAAELLHPEVRSQVHRRFQRGELRLGRLNWIYVFRDPPSFQMYYDPWHSYTDFFIANLSWITAATVYIAIVLTAMQVGLSTDALKNNKAFHRVSYGFTVFAILGPIIATLLLLLALIVALVPNWVNAKSATRRLTPSMTTTSNENV
ncbi:hypothetical protein GGS24DRAFT_491674 [Hypoxylon argillaceum]|nr:hypothetical protein GGS24DRAFT_491674 [Hypoxylon argillaceum]